MTSHDDQRDFDPSDPRLATAEGPRRLRDQPLLRLLAVNWAIGAAVAVALFGAVLITDTARLRSLMFASSEPWIPMLLLFVGFMITMCSVAMATAVMMLPKDEDDDDPKGGMKLEAFDLTQFTPPLAPARIPVRPDPIGRRPVGRDRRW